MLEKLTEEQEKLMHEVREEWLEYALNGKSPKKKEIFKSIDWLYGLIGKKNPIKIIVGSPLAAQIAAQILNSQVGSQVRSQVESQVWSQVGSQVRLQVESQVRLQVGSQVGSQVESQVESQVWSQVWSQVGSQVRSQVESQVRLQVWSQVRLQDFFSFSYEGFWNFGWLSFYDFFKTIGISCKAFDNALPYLKTRIWDYIFFENLAIAVLPPKKTHWKTLEDGQKVLNNDIGPAVEWKDGYVNYFLDGVSFEQELFEKIRDEKIASNEIISMKNVEQKRIVIQKVGWKKILDGLKNVKIIHKEGEYELLECDLNDDDGKMARFVKVVCPSTGREYCLRVDPNVKNCLDAVASTFKLESKQYILKKET